MSFLLIPIALSGFTTEKRPWMEISDPPSVRASKLVAAMTFKEQTDLFHGSCGGSVSFSSIVPYYSVAGPNL